MEFIKHPPEVMADNRTRLVFEVIVEAGYKPGESLAQEAALQQQFNGFAAETMGVFLKSFDTHGEPITVGKVIYTSKGTSPQEYQCYGGTIPLERHVYQSQYGGRTYCPLEEYARIIENTTPYFASIVTGKYSAQSAGAVVTDMARSMQRKLTVSYIQDLTESVGRAAQAKERFLAYDINVPAQKVHAVLVSADAANVNIVGESYKNVCAGCFCLMDDEGECLETIYLANSPEDGKVTFWQRMDLETQRLKKLFPDVPWFGISDGAADIQEWLHSQCDVVTLDFYHMSQYINEAKEAFGKDLTSQKDWVQKALHKLKHEEGSAAKLLTRMKSRSKSEELPPEILAPLVKAIGYLERNLERMEYALVHAEEMPIGSGVIEASCKRVIKQRACGSGMKWKRKGLQHVLSLRSLYLSSNRWEQFWKRCAHFGY